MAFMICAIIRADVDSLLSRYLNEAQDDWVPTEEGAFQTPSWTVIEDGYGRLIKAAQDNSITGREVPEVLKKAFYPAKAGKLVIVERVIKIVTTSMVNLK